MYKGSVKLQNENYENSFVVKIDGEVFRKYKISILREIMGDSGIAEEIVFGALKTHDLKLVKEMFKTTLCLKAYDSLINDRRFLSHEKLNYLNWVVYLILCLCPSILFQRPGVGRAHEPL